MGNGLTIFAFHDILLLHVDDVDVADDVEEMLLGLLSCDVTVTIRHS